MTLGILEVMQIQLRDYRIQPGNMDDWIAGWERGVVPLRQQAGFQIVGQRGSAARSVRVAGWLLRGDGFEAAKERYHAYSTPSAGQYAQIRLTFAPRCLLNAAVPPATTTVDAACVAILLQSRPTRTRVSYAGADEGGGSRGRRHPRQVSSDR